MDFENINEYRKEIIAKWEALGFLDGLSGHVKDNIAELYQCCKTNNINEKNKFFMLELENIKKDLYKSKVMATFSHYCAGNLYYNVLIEGEKYQFPIVTVIEEKDGQFGLSLGLSLSPDLGTTPFGSEIKASELIRWIGKAFEKGELIKVG